MPRKKITEKNSQSLKFYLCSQANAYYFEDVTSFHKIKLHDCRLTDLFPLVCLSNFSQTWCKLSTSVWPSVPTTRRLVLFRKTPTRPTHYSPEIYGYTDNQNKKKKHNPLEDFLTNARARTSETVTGTRLSYLTVEAFQFSLRLIPIIGGRLFWHVALFSPPAYANFKFYFCAV
jgi:hypothetical protein